MAPDAGFPERSDRAVKGSVSTRCAGSGRASCRRALVANAAGNLGQSWASLLGGSVLMILLSPFLHLLSTTIAADVTNAYRLRLPLTPTSRSGAVDRIFDVGAPGENRERKDMPRNQIPGPWLIVGALLALTACGSDDLLGPDAEQGIEGIVLLGPQCPVESLENPCPDLPYRAWINLRRGNGTFVTRIRSGEDGRFRIGLRPGLYLLDPESGNPFPAAREQEARVEEGVYTSVTVSFDTGIR